MITYFEDFDQIIREYMNYYTIILLKMVMLAENYERCQKYVLSYTMNFATRQGKHPHIWSMIVKKNFFKLLMNVFT